MTTAPTGGDTVPTFTEWLDRQQDRDGDQVGALARSVSEYGDEALDLEKRSVRQALRAAWGEYYEATGGDTEAPSAVGARR